MPATPDELFEPLPPVDRSEWETRVAQDLRTRTVDDLVTPLLEGIDVAPLYVRSDAPDAAGFPGCPPYTRGPAPLPRGHWVVCQRHSGPDLAAASDRIAGDLARGVDGLWLSITHDDARSGGGGANDSARLPIADLSSLETLLAHVSLRDTYLVLDAGAAAPAAAAMLAALARDRGEDLRALRGCLGCDPLGVLAASGRLPASLTDSMAVMVDLTAWCRMHAPGVRPIMVDLRAYHDAGATAVDELAYALATGVAYLRNLSDETTLPAGAPSIAEASSAIGFTFSVGRDLFLEVAKLRTARRLWAAALAVCGAPDAPPMHLSAQTSARTKSRRDPWVNALRATTETMAAAFGGAEVITTSTYDEALESEEPRARRLASATPHILAKESHLARVVDPMGGSWYVEHLTDELTRAAWARFQAIESLGGMETAILRGEIQKQTNVAREARARAIAERRTVLVGVSLYANASEPPPAGADESAPASEDARQSGARRGGSERAGDPTAGRGAVPSEPGARFDACVAAARDGASLADLVGATRSGSDEATAPALQRARDAEPFEALRDRADTLTANGGRPRAFLANLGERRVHGARSLFTRRLLEAGGFEVLDPDGSPTPADTAAAFATSDARIAVICSSDELYAAHAAATARALREAGADRVLLAGRPGEHETAWRAAGVDTFVFLGVNAVDVLDGLLSTLELAR